jgi:hypothetical protein
MLPLPFLALLDLQQSIMRTDYTSARLDCLSHEERVALDDISAQTYIDRIMWTEWYVSERIEFDEVSYLFEEVLLLFLL